MTHFYRRSKVDGNQREIVAALRAAGASVLSLASLGDGAPDLLVSHLGTMLLLEVKMPKEKLRPAQVRWVGVVNGLGRGATWTCPLPLA